jgi:fatty-acyl-CoA synthase
VIRTGGETVAPAEVEAVLRDHPAIADVAVVGLPDPDWGEIVCAVIVPAQGPGEPATATGATAGAPAHELLTLDRLRAYCTNRVPRHAVPRRLEVVPEIPRTESTGQVRRALLAQHLQTR